MSYNYALHLLVLELDKMRSQRDFNEKHFAEKGGERAYKAYCEAVDRIPSLEEAIKKIKS